MNVTDNQIEERYDLAIGNVEEWRKRERIANDASRLNWWNPRRTKLIYDMRNRGEKPRSPRNVDWVATFNRIFIALVCAAAVGVVYIVVSVLSALLSGRIAAVLESIRAAH